MASKASRYVKWFKTLTSKDTAVVGIKKASLGEVIATLKGEAFAAGVQKMVRSDQGTSGGE